MKTPPDIRVHPSGFEETDWHDAGSTKPWRLIQVARFAAITTAVIAALVGLAVGAEALDWRVIFSAF